MKRLRVPGAIALVLVLAMATACGSGPDLASHEGALRLIPDEPERRDAVWIIDYAALRELPLPVGAASNETLTPSQDLSLRVREHTGLTGVSPLASIEARAFPEIEQNWQIGLGFSVDDIDMDVQGGRSPAFVLGAAIGDFDASAIDAHLRACDECTQPLRRTRGRTTYYDWGDGLGVGGLLTPPVFDNLGRGGQYLFTDRYVLRALDSSTFESALDALGTDDSLEGNPTFVQLARTLDSLEDDGIELLATVMSDIHQGPEISESLFGENLDPARQAIFDAAFATALLRPYDGYALAAGLRDGEQITALVLVHRSTAAASENERRLGDRLESTLFWDQRPWEDIFTSWEIKTDGTTVIAVFGGQPRWEAVFLGDPLLFHE